MVVFDMSSVVEFSPASFSALAEEAFVSGAVTRLPRSSSVVCDVAGKTLFLKRAEIDLAPEAESIRAAAAADGHRAHAVSFAAYDETSNTLATHFVRGDSLFNRIWNGTSWLPRRRLDLDGTFAALGEWLKRYHHTGEGESDDAEQRQSATGWVRASLGRKLARLCSSGSAGSSSQVIAVDPDLSTRIERAADCWFGDAAWSSIAMARIHGDFTHANVLVASCGKCVVLDFTDTRWGFALEDVVRMWCALGQIGATGRRRSEAARRAQEAFLRSYGAIANKDDCESVPFRAVRLWNAITKINEYVSNSHVVDRNTRRILRSMARAELAWVRSVV